MRPFLVLQLRPEAEASDNEYRAILEKGGLTTAQTVRYELNRDTLPGDLDLSDFSGTIVGGGPGCVSDAPEEKTPDEARIESAILGLMPQVTGGDLPFMGCCYGIGVLGRHLGAPVGKGRYGEPVGPSRCALTRDGRDDPVLSGLPDSFDALVGHKEAVEALPAGCVHLLTSDPCPFQMIRHGRNVYATQFHPEADGDVFALRIRIYHDRGYFAPGEAGALEARVRSADTAWPGLILRNFVARYARD